MPTILKIMDITIPSDVDGKILFDIFEKENKIYNDNQNKKVEINKLERSIKKIKNQII